MNKQFPVTKLFVFSSILAVLVANAQEEGGLQKEAASADIYAVESRDDIHKFSAREIRELVQLENEKNQGEGTIPHPVLAYCFDEKTFQYTGGQYQNAEIKYRLHTPKNIRNGRKYPLIIHLHGGADDAIIHLHSILPMMIGPERQDFFMLVTQASRDETARPGWYFQTTKDGTLDIMMAAMEHVIADNPIDKKRITVTGVSSGGWGVWELLSKYPGLFAGAVPTSCSAPSQLHRLETLKKTPIWSFINKKDHMVNPESIRIAARTINNAGGSMALTECNAADHNAWRPAMETYHCFRWMLAQQKGSWFAPPPGTIVHKPASLLLVPFMYLLPLGIIIFLLWNRIGELMSGLFQRILERFHKNSP